MKQKKENKIIGTPFKDCDGPQCEMKVPLHSLCLSHGLMGMWNTNQFTFYF